MECNDGDAAGTPTDLTFKRYRKLAEGGAGIIIVESLTISYESRSRKNQLKISEETAPDIREVGEGDERRSMSQSLILFQINHSGKRQQCRFFKSCLRLPHRTIRRSIS